MWLTNSSIGRKVVMSITGTALILFITFHSLMNVVALISAKGYNMICEFLGANWYAVAASVVLAVLMLLHFVFAILLTVQNRRARGSNRYDITRKPEKVEWASQNMFVLGIIICLGLLLHLWNFWYNMQFAELAGIEGPISPTDGVAFIARTFSCPLFTIIYIIWLAAIWFHLNHGFWSAMQTLGWSGKVWFTRWRVIGCVYTTVVLLLFAAVPVAYCCGYRPADFNAAQGSCQCPKEMMASPAPQHGAPACMGKGCDKCPACQAGACCPECPKCCAEGGCETCPLCAKAKAGCFCPAGCACETCAACSAKQPRCKKGGAPRKGHHQPKSCPINKPRK